MNIKFYQLYTEGLPALYATEAEAEEIRQITNEAGGYDYEFEEMFREVDIEAVDLANFSTPDFDALGDERVFWGDTSDATKAAMTEAVRALAELSPIMTAGEAVACFGLSESAVRQAINRGQILARLSGGTWLIRRADAERRWGKK